MSAMVTLSVSLFIEPLWLKIIVIVAGLVGVGVVLFAVPEAK